MSSKTHRSSRVRKQGPEAKEVAVHHPETGQSIEREM